VVVLFPVRLRFVLIIVLIVVPRRYDVTLCIIGVVSTINIISIISRSRHSKHHGAVV
jgi:hypothetical protein